MDLQLHRPSNQKEVPMDPRFRHAGHLVRLAVALAAGIVLFLVVQRLLVPPTFGRYGHYRAASVEEVAARPVRFAGQGACVECHTDQAQVRASGKHAHISCEACHGALAAHAEDASSKPQLPAVVPLCTRCHEADAAKPVKFAQVKTAEHSGGAACNDCHQPHNPKL
jgi:hypothetical protein